jgi:hypothetical protein
MFERGSPAEVFLSYLDELPLRVWLHAARRGMHDDGMQRAEAALAELIAHNLDGETARMVRLAIANSLARFEGPEGRRAIRALLAGRFLRPATERAAFAVLLRQHLTADQFHTLYGSFADAVPAAFLFGLDDGSGVRRAAK